MGTTNNFTNNDGIISLGDKNHNELHKKIYYKKDEIQWEILHKEIDSLKSNSDPSVKKFVDEASYAVQKKDKQGFLRILKEWLPHIGNFIESSYYIIEIAKNFGI